MVRVYMAEFSETTETRVKLLSSNEILAELAQARDDFLNGKGEDFDEAVADITYTSGRENPVLLRFSKKRMCWEECQ